MYLFCKIIRKKKKKNPSIAKYSSLNVDIFFFDTECRHFFNIQIR